MSSGAQTATTTMEAPTESCVTCKRPISENYCSQCGELRASQRHYTVRHFLSEIVEGFTHADHTVWSTLQSLVMKPGELTLAFVRGQRKHLLGPVQLFLLMNLVFFAVQSLLHGGGPLTPTLEIQKIEPYHNVAMRMIDRSEARSGIPEEEYVREFDHSIALRAKSMVIVIVPAFAIFAGVLMVAKRRFLVHHLVFALHFCSFVLLSLSIALALLHGAIPLLPKADYEAIVTWSIYCLWAAYLLLAYRRAYSASWIFSSAAAVASVFAFQWILYGYRFLMLLLTKDTIHA
ncbi:MAG TPA: DUF3667 domain-containing protein [Terriglobales bacterium]|jgi:hypothetical protein